VLELEGVAEAVLDSKHGVIPLLFAVITEEY
jgi:hypothetical protein